VADLLDTIMHDSGYVDMLRDGTDEGEDRFANLQELRGVAAQYLPGMAGMLDEQTRSPSSWKK
jgi:superfamily I DNA/RNA helicase